MADPASLRDRVLVGRYRLDERLGAGGMGSIWRAHHLVLAAPVAVKLIDREAIPDDDTMARFMREAQSAATLRSPHVVQIIDYGVDDKLPFIVMELLEGENLAQRLRRVGKLGPGETARILTHMGRAVGRAHEAGIVHRDLKPENVFLVRNEDEEIAKVLDFGVAKVSVGALGVIGAEGTRTRTGSILGTPYYMSPEQAQGNKTVDHRSDLWSLGVIAFECLTGKRPFYSEGLGDLVLQICIRDIPIPSQIALVPVGFDAWFARAVARDPATRFQSARELTEALREVLGDEDGDVQWTSPDAVLPVPIEEAPNSQARTRLESAPPDSAAATMVGQSNSRVRLTSGSSIPDQHAATVAVETGRSDPFSAPSPSQRTNSAVIAEMLASASHSSLPPRRSGFGLIFAVAGTALAIGLGAGLIFMKKRDDQNSRPLPAAVPPPREAAVPHPKPKPEHTPEHAASAHEDPAPPSSGAVKPAPVTRSEAAQPSPSAKPGPSAQTIAPSAPDAGWVKPAWAIPDDEPRRVHDDAHDAGK